MALYYSLVFGLLIFEMSLFVMMVFPFPKKWRRVVFMKIDESGIIRKNQWIINVVGVFVFILFADSINRMIKASAEADQANLADPRTDTQLHVKKFYSQRNMYLTGFTLFLSLILDRTFSILMDLFLAEEKLEKIKGQGKGNLNKETKNMEENDMKQKKRIAELTDEIAQLKSNARDSETLKKKTEDQAKEYLKLADEHIELQNTKVKSEE
ncbi:B-cell receptor-associated 31-like protein [Basidiobolus meristosporus CBS 931.73]|uniref:Endoplasmic reticulum transmembrane protein n=1 Tax=Basidiobolus meristosporus CBS 931.73 TaxID=1314790 RepID=A0A1Y1ZBT5_9FUNG|nr:B-cell receptor-associated 31-like protein [Basidiobolus meristosporus CBS 931.73]|eukprot:ORY07719.1 B-cell receptor-associated 31-like protein [Basidiobolus meristosporus CBS 931.73]